MKIDTLEDVGITGTMHFKGLEGVSLGGSYKVKSDAKLVPDKIKIGSSFEVWFSLRLREKLLFQKPLFAHVVWCRSCDQVGGRFVPDLNLDSIIDVDIAGTGVGLDLVVKPKGSKVHTPLLRLHLLFSSVCMQLSVCLICLSLSLFLSHLRVSILFPLFSSPPPPPQAEHHPPCVAGLDLSFDPKIR